MSKPLILIGASFNYEEKSDKEIREKAEEYKKEGRVSFHKFSRRRNSEVDENKNLLPVHPNISVPISGCIAIQSKLLDLENVIVSSKEYILLVNGLNDFFRNYTETGFGYEGDNPTLGTTLISGTERSEDKSFLFLNGDIPFFSLPELLEDPDLKNYDFVMDFNAEENIFFNGKRLFDRNYYHIGYSKRDGVKKNIKEPTVFYLLNEKELLEFANKIYTPRRERGQISNPPFLRNLLLFGVRKGFNYIKNSAKNSINGIELLIETASFRKNLRNHKLDLDIAEKIMSYALNCKVKMKAQHSDPFRVRDIDAWEDLIYYWLVIDEANRRYNGKGLEMLLPYGGKIKEFGKYVKAEGIDEKIGLLNNVRGYANERARKLGMQRIFDNSGNLIAKPSRGEDIGASVDYLINRREKEKKYFDNFK